MTETCKTLRRGLADEGKAAPIWAAVVAVAGERPGHRPAPDPP